MFAIQRSAADALDPEHCEPVNERAQNIVAAYREGKTLAEIGHDYGITGERIRQIIKSCGITYEDSGKHKNFLSRSAARSAAKVEARERHCRDHYGCTWQEFRAITFSKRPGRASPIAKAYWAHKANARKSRLAWTITLPQYVELVGPNLEAIGRGKMTLCRRDKTGPFSYENCSVETQSHNSKITNGFGKGRDAQKERSEKRRRKAIELAGLGLSRKEISEKMRLSLATVHAYFRQEKNENLQT